MGPPGQGVAGDHQQLRWLHEAESGPGPPSPAEPGLAGPGPGTAGAAASPGSRAVNYLIARVHYRSPRSREMEKLRQRGGGDKIDRGVNLNSSLATLRGKLRHEEIEALPPHEGI